MITPCQTSRFPLLSTFTRRCFNFDCSSFCVSEFRANYCCSCFKLFYYRSTQYFLISLPFHYLRSPFELSECPRAEDCKSNFFFFRNPVWLPKQKFALAFNSFGFPGRTLKPKRKTGFLPTCHLAVYDADVLLAFVAQLNLHETFDSLLSAFAIVSGYCDNRMSTAIRLCVMDCFKSGSFRDHSARVRAKEEYDAISSRAIIAYLKD